jgi:hypothetical protein
MRAAITDTADVVPLGLVILKILMRNRLPPDLELPEQEDEETIQAYLDRLRDALYEISDDGSSSYEPIEEMLVELEEENPDCVDFLRAVFTPEPADRPTVAQLLDTTFIATGLDAFYTQIPVRSAVDEAHRRLVQCMLHGMHDVWLRSEAVLPGTRGAGAAGSDEDDAGSDADEVDAEETDADEADAGEGESAGSSVVSARDHELVLARLLAAEAQLAEQAAELAALKAAAAAADKQEGGQAQPKAQGMLAPALKHVQGAGQQQAAAAQQQQAAGVHDSSAAGAPEPTTPQAKCSADDTSRTAGSHLLRHSSSIGGSGGSGGSSSLATVACCHSQAVVGPIGAGARPRTSSRCPSQPHGGVGGADGTCAQQQRRGWWGRAARLLVGCLAPSTCAHVQQQQEAHCLAAPDCDRVVALLDGFGTTVLFR